MTTLFILRNDLTLPCIYLREWGYVSDNYYLCCPVALTLSHFPVYCKLNFSGWVCWYLVRGCWMVMCWSSLSSPGIWSTKQEKIGLVCWFWLLTDEVQTGDFQTTKKPQIKPKHKQASRERKEDYCLYVSAHLRSEIV